MMTRRSRAREVALQLLFQKDVNPKPLPRTMLEQFARERLLESGELTSYCLSLFDGTVAKQAEIDPKITATAENWRLNRMTPVDRNLLRLASFELLYEADAQPVEVVIDEAIELARRFGSADSSKFVNGILDKIARLRSAECGVRSAELEPPTEPPAPPAHDDSGTPPA